MADQPAGTRSGRRRSSRALGAARDAQVLQVCVGLALGHRAPAARLEQLLARTPARWRSARARGEIARTRSSRSSWWRLIARVRAGRSSKGWPCAGSTCRDVRDLRDAIERVEERRQRVGRRRDARDVRRDGRQHVVARQQDALGGIVQADVIRGVAGRVHDEPLAIGELRARRRARPGGVIIGMNERPNRRMRAEAHAHQEGRHRRRCRPRACGPRPARAAAIARDSSSADSSDSASSGGSSASEPPCACRWCAARSSTETSGVAGAVYGPNWKLW